MDRLEHLGHQLHLGARRDREHIAVEVDGAPMVFGLRKSFSHSLQHTKAIVSNDKFYAVQTTATQLLEKTDPAGLVLFHALDGAQNLAGSVLIDRNRLQNGCIFKLSAPVAAQIYPIHIDIWITPGL